MLLKAQTKPTTGDPIRQNRRQLPRLRPRRINPTVDQTLCPQRLDLRTNAHGVSLDFSRPSQADGECLQRSPDQRGHRQKDADQADESG